MKEDVLLGLETTADPRLAKELAVRTWNETFRLGMSHEGAAEYIWKNMITAGREVMVKGAEQYEVAEQSQAFASSMAVDLLFLAAWAHNAFATLECSHRLAAVLACTDTGKDILRDLPVPWLAFRVLLPSGVISLGERAFTEARVLILPGGAATLRVVDAGKGCLRAVAADAWSLLFCEIDPETVHVDAEEPGVHRDFSPLGKREERVLRTVKRLIVGLLIELAYGKNFKDRAYGDRGVVDPRDGDPMHRSVLFGTPIKLDARSTVHRYLNGDEADRQGAPSFQTLVRGHHKRQVVGVGRSGRKVIWIMPYWRGPEEAPILARPYRA